MKMLKTFIVVFGFAVLIVSGIYFPLSKFTGQHSFIQGQSVNCAECHPNQAGNLSLSVYHSNLSCRTCHNTTFSPGQEAHAASIPRCIDCHTSVVNEINNTYEAHMPLFRTAEDYGIRRGPNEACLLCHTNYSANITFLYYDYINYTVYNNGTSAPRPSTYYWQLESVIIGPQRTYAVEIKNQGESTHYWKNLLEISCVRCHVRIRLGNLGNAQGSQHAGDVADKGGTDPGHQNASYGGATDAYCKSCHRNASFDIYAAAPYYNYNLNSSAVHAAIKLTCLTCHNASGPYPPSNETPDKGGHYSEEFYPQVAQNVTRRLVGDLCTGCHRASNHDISSGACSNCHGPGSGRVNNKVYTEPKAAEASQWVYRSFP